MSLPVLYSLRNCPYAMRARLAIYRSKQVVELRDIVLTNKPAAFLDVSPKATVPTLVLSSSKVIDESLDLMLWALSKGDPNDLLRMNIDDRASNSSDTEYSQELNEILSLVKRFDDEFVPCLDAYKCAKRYHESNLNECRQACEALIQELEQRLSLHAFVIDNKESIADIALLPFIRKFAKIERQWYLQSPYPELRRWLDNYLQSRMFSKVMAKYPLWSLGQPVVEFGDN